MPRNLTLTKNDAVGIGIDRRRRVRRELASSLVNRAKMLPQHDRLLIEAVFRDGKSIAEIWELGLIAATASRVIDQQNHGAPQNIHERLIQLRRLRRHLKRLVDRMATPRFAYVAVAIDTWPTTRKRVAMACVLWGYSIRKAARELDLTVHTVRRNLQLIDAICDATKLVTQHTTQAVWRQPNMRGGRK